MRVAIVLKEDQRTGHRTIGEIGAILTPSESHHRGIKVRLRDGQVGRVQEILPSEVQHSVLTIVAVFSSAKGWYVRRYLDDEIEKIALGIDAAAHCAANAVASTNARQLQLLRAGIESVAEDAIALLHEVMREGDAALNIIAYYVAGADLTDRDVAHWKSSGWISSQELRQLITEGRLSPESLAIVGELNFRKLL